MSLTDLSKSEVNVKSTVITTGAELMPLKLAKLKNKKVNYRPMKPPRV